LESPSVRTEHETLLRRKPGTAGCTCPYCGHDGQDDAFVAPEDVKAIEDYVAWAVEEDVGDFLDKLATDFTRSQQNSLISLSMTVQRSRNMRPHPWREDLLRGLTCDLCGRAYGVYAIALFCPDCGGRNIHVHFRREVELVRKQVELSAQAEAQGDEELGYRLLGNAHEDVLTALETYLKVLFLFLAKRRCDAATFEKLEKEARRGNPFQRIDRGSRLYAEINLDPFRLLSAEDRDFLILHIEKRHVIGHNLGLADEKYLENVGHENEGENVRILGADVLRFADLAYRIIVEGIESSESEFRP